jgi:preprotein translocase subunit SecE
LRELEGENLRRFSPPKVNSMIEFFNEVRSELAKVIWPSKSETLRYTLTVIAFSIIVSVILGVCDYGLLLIFEKIVTR